MAAFRSYVATLTAIRALSSAASADGRLSGAVIAAHCLSLNLRVLMVSQVWLRQYGKFVGEGSLIPVSGKLADVPHPATANRRNHGASPSFDETGLQPRAAGINVNMSNHPVREMQPSRKHDSFAIVDLESRGWLFFETYGSICSLWVHF
jgi:hypothetical protein